MRCAGAADPASRCGATRADGGGTPSERSVRWFVLNGIPSSPQNVYLHDTKFGHALHTPQLLRALRDAALRFLSINIHLNRALRFADPRPCAKLLPRSNTPSCGCRRVELRALCDKVPRTPPGPEGSNGTGNALGAADHPKFLSPPAETMPWPRTRDLVSSIHFCDSETSMNFQPS